jgi:hypothetical protein
VLVGVLAADRVDVLGQSVVVRRIAKKKLMLSKAAVEEGLVPGQTGGGPVLFVARTRDVAVSMEMRVSVRTSSGREQAAMPWRFRGAALPPTS